MDFSEQDLDTLSRTIYGEARGEFYKFGLAPLITVANVVFNRKKKKFAKSIHEVCKAPYQFSCWNKNDPNFFEVNAADKNSLVFRKCWEIAENILTEK